MFQSGGRIGGVPVGGGGIPLGGVGRSDIDPPGLGGPMGGGGMIFDPLREGRGGGIGPRFDPVVPGMPNPGLFGGRGPRGPGPRGPFGGGGGFGDEFGPPGFNDGGFM